MSGENSVNCFPKTMKTKTKKYVSIHPEPVNQFAVSANRSAHFFMQSVEDKLGENWP